MIGRFEILDKLGEGGMGEVFKARDSSDGKLVAVKVLNRRIMSNRQAVRRFQKEARLLGEIKSPYVTNLVEVNQDNGQHYIVMDYVSGVDLRKMIRKSAPFSERVALSVMADVARGLVSAHQREIIHRDIKPGNILLAYDPQDTSVDVKSAKLDASSLKRFRVKLSDFGLAREVDQSESMQMTREGGSVGTPMYMSPEQFSDGKVSPATDVYSMGITLYEMLAGKPPFRASDITQLINSHCRESPARLQTVDGELSEATCEIVQRAIAKQPQDRYSDAGQFLSDIERVLRGEASNVDAHPHVPSYEPGEIFEEIFEWQLEGDAADLWPYVSNTERINSAVGVPSVTYDTRRDDQGRLRKYGAFRMAGLQIGWEEHPFEWIEGQRLGILREFQQGPFVWFLSIVELIPQFEGGTLLRHSVRILPRGLIGRLVATLEVRVKGKRNLERVYRRIDRAVSGGLGTGPTVDPFSQSAKLSAARRRLLDGRLDCLANRGTDPDIVECLGQFLREAPAQELGRIRPIALGRNFSVDSDRMIAGCLAAAKEGLLDLHWDILCPTCRISSQVSTTLKEIRNHARCEVCDLDFEVDLAQSVEMIFRANPEVREADLGTYCIGGPEHSPHVVLQLRLPAGERVELTPVLSEGAYVLRSAQLPYNYRLRALPGKGTTHTEIVLSNNLEAAHASQVRAGRNALTLTNDYDREIVVRLERSIPMKDVVTAAQASSLPMFREMFPDESPKLGQLINVSTVTLLAIDLVDADRIYEDLDDASAFLCVRQFHTQLEQLAAKHSGAIVKVMGTETLLAFETPLEIMNLVAELVEKLNQAEQNLQLCAAVHHGTALATSIDEHLDYFGSTVHIVRRIMQQAGAGELWITEAVAADPLVVQTIQDRQLTTEFIDLPQLGRSGMRCQRVTLA
ncbi:MAG: protein kinase domain-containing protein [Bythopirellula sp.]